jgi:Lrp/AsnC family leucine-responsive transcriptional regulator
MDDVDSEILGLLRDNGRMSWRDLGASVGLSANAAAERVSKLRQAGVVKGFAAVLDPALVGVTLMPGTDSDEFATLAVKLHSVTEVLHLAGRPDYQLRVACRDTGELDALLRTLRLRLGAADTDTTVILRSGPPA